MHTSWESTAGVDYYRLLMLVCLLLWKGKYSMSPFCNTHRSLLELCALNKKNSSLCHSAHMWHIYLPHMMFRSVWPACRQTAFCSSQCHIYNRQHVVTCDHTNMEKPSPPGSHAPRPHPTFVVWTPAEWGGGQNTSNVSKRCSGHRA